MGCGRSIEEIIAWSAASDIEKSATLERSRQRLAARKRD